MGVKHWLPKATHWHCKGSGSRLSGKMGRENGEEREVGNPLICIFCTFSILTFVLMDESLLTDSTDFGWRTRKAREPKIDHIDCYGFYFNCGCGKRHMFTGKNQLLHEVGSDKLILQDRSCEFKNCVKITKQFLGPPKGLKTLFSTLED